MTYVGFSALNFIPPVDASAIYNTHPVFMAVVSAMFLKEKHTLFQTIIIFFILIAVFLICQPEFLFGSISTISPVSRIIGSLLSLSAGICLTIAHAVIRYVKHLPLSVLNFVQGVLVTTGYLIIFRNNITCPTNLKDSLVLCFCACVGAFGRILSAAALQREKATIVAAIMPVQLAVVTILQTLILGIIPNAATISGAALLMCCVTMLSLRKEITSKLKAWFSNATDEEQKSLCTTKSANPIVK